MRRNEVRSGFEHKIVSMLKKLKISFEYEPIKIKYVQPAKNRTYTPDFKIGPLFIEAKGRLTREDRNKLCWIRESNPDMRLVILLQDSTRPLYKGSPTSYGEWCTKQQFEWADFSDGIPKEWIKKEK